MAQDTATVRDAGSDDIVIVLREQHDRIRTLFSEVRGSAAETRQQRFDDLRATLAVHETAEELVLRPASRRAVGDEIVEQRNTEEKQASAMLSRLEGIDPDSVEFHEGLAQLEDAVLQHAQNEETIELPALLVDKTPEERADLGRALRATEQIAPTHPHPSTAGSPGAQLLVGPFASMLDRARDLLSGH